MTRQQLDDTACVTCGETVYRCAECQERPADCACGETATFEAPEALYRQTYPQTRLDPAEYEEVGPFCFDCYPGEDDGYDDRDDDRYDTIEERDDAEGGW